MNTLPGIWDLSLKTPIGTLAAQYHFVQRGDVLEGSATSAAETVPLRDIVLESVDGATTRATWKQRVSKPMRLNLEFDVTLQGDTMSGHSRAGRLPRTVVSGRKRAE